MDILQNHIEETKQLLTYQEYTILLKRVIDLALDTEDIIIYRKVSDFLDWYDTNFENAEKDFRFIELIDTIYDSLKEKPLESGQPKLLLKTINLIRSYSNSAFALGPINLEIREKQILGLVGENGNGKTTLLRSLCGELNLSGGDIQYNFSYKDLYDLRTQLIYIPQRTDTWHGDLLSNLRFTAAMYGITGEENLLLVELIIARMGLRKYRDYKWKNLSSGYKMRFELARALLRRPKLLLIDEPLANLDILAQQTVLDDLNGIATSLYRPIGIILSSQQLYEVEKASDQVIFLKNGSPRNLTQDTDVTFAEIPKLIVEFESEWNQEQLRNILSEIGVERLQINGGTYVATFPVEITQQNFIELFIREGVPFVYFRNISNSTRRFFLS